MLSSDWIDPPPLPPLSGEEVFNQVGATVSDFWRWAVNDLRMNIVRGTLAEFLVARALGVDTSLPRRELENYDLVLADGTKIEVKSSGYWQSWKQKGPTVPKFAGLITRKLDDETNVYTVEREVWADVYVFALQRCEAPDDYDVLDVDQWRFWVAPAEDIRRENRQSVTLQWVQKNASVFWTQIQDAVEMALEADRRQIASVAKASVWIPGEPVLFMGRREKEWQQAIADAVGAATHTHPRLLFRVAAFRRRGHYFDLDNLLKPAIDELAGPIDSVWASIHEAEEPGLEISDERAPDPPEESIQFRIEEPASSSVKREAPVPEVLAIGALGVDEPVGIDLAFDDEAPLSDFGFTGPIKPSLDMLGPMLGTYGQGAADYRIRELRVRHKCRPGSAGLTVSAWLLEVPSEAQSAERALE